MFVRKRTFFKKGVIVVIVIVIVIAIAIAIVIVIGIVIVIAIIQSFNDFSKNGDKRN